MIHEDIVVYADPDGVHYLANFEDLGWRRWPAEHGGWEKRTSCLAGLAERSRELEPKLADLALRLSGVSL